MRLRAPLPPSPSFVVPRRPLTFVSNAAPPALFASSTFDAAVKEFGPLLVEFYAPWCGHCKKLKPEYAEAASMLKAEGLKVAMVDATEEKELASRFQIQGFPTLKFFAASGTSSEYSGAREARAIAEFVRKKSGPVTVPVDTVESVNNLIVGKSDAVVFVGFFADAGTKNLFEEVAKANDDAAFAVSESDALRAEYKIAAGAAGLVAVNNFASQPQLVVFEGDVTADAVSTFVAKNSLPYIIPFRQETVAKIFQGTVKQHYLLFADPAAPETETIYNDFREIAKEFAGKLLFVSVDPKEAKVVEYFGITNFPSAAIANMEGAMKKYIIEGGVSLENLKSFLTSYLDGGLKPSLKSEPEPPADPTSSVRVLVGKTFEREVINGDKEFDLVEFYAPWCGHCKSLAPIWENLAAAYKDSREVGIYKMDYTANEIDFPGVTVKGFPTVRPTRRERPRK